VSSLNFDGYQLRQNNKRAKNCNEDELLFLNPWEVQYPQAPLLHFYCPLEDKKCATQILGLIVQLKQMKPAVCEEFLYPVNPRLYKTYLKYVFMPMSISVIEERLSEQYYRSKEELLANIRMIHSNCVLFNCAGSKISKLAQQLVDFLELIVQHVLSVEDSSDLLSDILNTSSQRRSRPPGGQRGAALQEG